MDVVQVSGLGNDSEVIRIPYANGTSIPHLINVIGRRFTFTDANVTNREFQRRMLLALEDPTALYSRMDLTVEQLETGEQWQIRDAIVVADDTSFSTENDSLVFTNITFDARIIERGTSPSLKPITAHLGDVTIFLPGKIGLTLETEFRGGSTPGTEGARGAFVRCSGWKGEIEFYLTTDNGINPEHELLKIAALARKGDNQSPPIVKFVFGAESFKCRVIKFSPERIHRDKTGRALIARGVVEIEEVYVEGTGRTSREQKGLQIFTVSGEGYTYERIAYELFGDEQLAMALMAFNPEPSRNTPIITAGTEVIVPPWDFVSQYQTRRAAPWLR